MGVKWDEALTALASDRYPRLIGRAMLLCGNRALAEDLVQEALVAALRTRRTFESLNQAEQYVRRAIASRYVDAMRSESASRRRERHDFDPTQAPDVAVAVDTSLDLAHALRSLPPRNRACVALRYLEGLSTRETAEALGLSEGSVKRYLSDGIHALNAALGTRGSADDMGHVVTPKGGTR
jgi:RNA polymerase sigma factor (sigma-70 family)